MPPILLEFKLPSDYPSKSPPIYKLYSRWLSVVNLEKICSNLDNLWDQSGNSNILFTWISFLTDEIFNFLKIDTLKTIDIEEDEHNVKETGQSRAIKLPCSLNLLKKYDSDQEDTKFFKAYHQCDVCFLEKSGYQSFRFEPCHHIYCNECMKSYFATQIADGNVKR